MVGGVEYLWSRYNIGSLSSSPASFNFYPSGYTPYDLNFFPKTFRGYQYQFGLGYAFFVADRTAIEPSLSYQVRKGDFDGNSLGLNIGFSLYF